MLGSKTIKKNITINITDVYTNDKNTNYKYDDE